MIEDIRQVIKEELKDVMDRLDGIDNRLDDIDDKLSNFVRFYLMTWVDVQGRQTELQEAQEKLKKAVGL